MSFIVIRGCCAGRTLNPKITLDKANFDTLSQIPSGIYTATDKEIKELKKKGVYNEVSTKVVPLDKVNNLLIVGIES